MGDFRGEETILRSSDELQAINMQAGIRGALDQMRKERRSKEEEISRMYVSLPSPSRDFIFASRCVEK